MAVLIYDELTAAERALWDAFPEGRWVDLRTGVPEEDDPATGAEWGAGRTVRAEVVAALLLGGGPARPGGVAAL
ncbi:oxidoreductase, partial [Streptomyces albidoflavus]